MPPLKKLAVWLSTGFGLGYSPVFPGTVGCLLGLPLAWAIQETGRWMGHEIPFHITAAAILSLMAVPLCSAGNGLPAPRIRTAWSPMNTSPFPSA